VLRQLLPFLRHYPVLAIWLLLGATFGILWLRRGADPLARAIRELTPIQQWMIYLRFGADFDTREIAQIMGQPEDRVRRLQLRALRRLLQVLDERRRS
jgi:DNA-directed RNA polymerase specialized sigma24 family protein